ncbi:MAG TPA: thioredoxin family protein [Lacipirellulaceae bacterium]|jgi:protein disulfide-isomerase|nr:thioredoxin family protein [Lacipirellulaceae bacterium]
MYLHWRPLTVALSLLLAAPAWAQDAVHWHNDLESAKTVARESKRLVLIHFWTPSCVPCKALEQNVFSQPGVATALENQFVPVKLNADENPATAQSFGITRVPTDVIITPDGQVVGKLVSPSTPAAYIAETTGLANKYAANTGSLYAGAISTAPAQSQLTQMNSAYARLQIAPNNPTVAPSIVPPGSSSPNFATVQGATSPVAPVTNPAMPSALAVRPVAQAIPTQPATMPSYGSPAAPPSAPQTINNPAAQFSQAPVAQSPITPIGVPTLPPAQVANPYLAASAPAQSFIPTSPPAAAVPGSLPSYGAQPPAPAAAVAAGASAVPDPRLLPAGAPALAFDGYCAVSMRNKWQWVPGNPQYGIVHLGRTYWFAGPEEQKQFWADPARYAPALSGNDPVLAIDHQQQVPGKREHSLDYDGLFYMFASEATLQQFTANPARYEAGARQAMGLPRGRLVR